MYFKRLEVHGFKSFAEPVIIDFHEGVTCIVGPNGSGKSNFSDAIRWVLGEQSPRLLRAGKMEEIIFAGTQARKSRGMAEVTLVIDNSTGILPIEYNEVAITRRLYRSGESEYLINNNPCRLRDIRELIMDTGIGVDGYSIIGQGRIADIVSSKPEARREIFEEAAGVVLYKTKKQEAQRKLEATDANLDRANDIIGEIESRIDSLKEDSEKAKEFIELRDRRRELEINITLRNVEKFNDSNLASEEDVKNLEGEITKYTLEKENVDEKVNALRERSSVLEELNNESKDKLLISSNELNQVMNKTSLNQEKVSQIEKDRERINRELEEYRAKLDEELKNSESEENKKASFDDDVKKSNDDLAKAISKYNEIISSNFNLNLEIEAMKNEIFALVSKENSFRADAKSTDGIRESLIKQKQSLEIDNSDINNNNEELKEQLNGAKESLINCDETINENKEKITSLLSKKNELVSEIRSLTKESEDLKLAGREAISRKKTIEEMEANYEGLSYGVKYIMGQNLPGINGVVSELIEVPHGFETAIETALGSGLQNIICDKDIDAKKAINLLKENRAGRLTFLPLESVNGNEAKPNDFLTSAFGFEGMASSIVKCDPKYRGIINYLLGRTAIVKDMDTAIKVSKAQNQGIRFVTLEGEIINQSGAITGGRTKSQSLNILSRKTEIQDLDLRIAKLRKDYQEKIELIEKKNNLGNELEKQLSEANDFAALKQIERAELSAKIASIEESSKDFEEAKIKRERNLTNLIGDIENAEKLSIKALADADDLKEKIDTLNIEIADKQKQYDANQNLISDANEEVTKARLFKGEVENRLEKIDAVLEKILDNIDEYTEQIDSREDALTKLDKAYSEIIFGSTDQTDDVTKLAEEINTLNQRIDEIQKEKNSVSMELAEKIKEQETLNFKLNSSIDTKNQLQINRAKNEANLENAKQKLWDDFEISYAQALELKSDDFVYSTAVKESRQIKNRIDELGDVNVGSIQEYQTVSERYEFLTKQREDILKAESELKEIIDNMDRNIRVKFKESFDKVACNFEQTFKELFDGGDAELTLLDENNPLESGIDINVQPPGKKVQNISSFSGGEQTMIGLALMLAVLKAKPTPFCILDEVEAALDDSNIDKFAKSLRNFNDVQFAVITHQKATMEHADVLYGVTMPERGISKVLSLRLGDNLSQTNQKFIAELDASKEN